MFTEAINHDPAITFFQTGSQIAGRPSMGAWLHYGLGSDNENLPAFVVLDHAGQGRSAAVRAAVGQRLSAVASIRACSSAAARTPVLYLANPDGVTPREPAALLDRLKELHAHAAERLGDPEMDARIAQYEMAFPHADERAGRDGHLERDAGDARALRTGRERRPARLPPTACSRAGWPSAACKFIQLYHQGWDQHDDLPRNIRRQCEETDQASAALVIDLKQRGMLDDTLVVWGGEFGRTSYSQGKLTATNYGRDHHPRCFTMWMAGGGVKPGLVHGATDDFGYNITDGGVHVHDLQATLLHLLGIDHERLTYRTRAAASG